MASDRYSSLVKMDGAATIGGWTMETVVIVDASVSFPTIGVCATRISAVGLGSADGAGIALALSLTSSYPSKLA